MSSFTTFLTFALSSLVIASAATAAPSCFQIDRRVFGKDLGVPCFHLNNDYTVAYDVQPDGSAEVHLPYDTSDPSELELYSGPRMTTAVEDCCPPETFLSAISCPIIQPVGTCTISGNVLTVSGLPEQTGCVHSVETYNSYVPSSGSVQWLTNNAGANPEVEVYASQHPLTHPTAPGCCYCHIYNIPCSVV